MQGHGHPSYKWVQDIPYALRTIFKNYHLHQGSSCHLTISIASSGLHDLCKVIRVFIKGSKTSWASPLSTKASGSSLGSSASSAGLLQELQQSGDIDDIKTMLASMTISSTISPFVIDDNNSCSPYEHAPILSSSLPLSSSLLLWHK